MYLNFLIYCFNKINELRNENKITKKRYLKIFSVLNKGKLHYLGLIENHREQIDRIVGNDFKFLIRSIVVFYRSNRKFLKNNKKINKVFKIVNKFVPLFLRDENVLCYIQYEDIWYDERELINIDFLLEYNNNSY